MTSDTLKISETRDLQNQSKVQANEKFEAIQQEEHGDPAVGTVLAAGAESLLAYNSSHIHPKTSTKHQNTRETRKQREQGTTRTGLVLS